jgi:hypothetical protein
MQTGAAVLMTGLIIIALVTGAGYLYSQNVMLQQQLDEQNVLNGQLIDKDRQCQVAYNKAIEDNNKCVADNKSLQGQVIDLTQQLTAAQALQCTPSSQTTGANPTSSSFTDKVFSSSVMSANLGMLTGRTLLIFAGIGIALVIVLVITLLRRNRASVPVHVNQAAQMSGDPNEVYVRMTRQEAANYACTARGRK